MEDNRDIPMLAERAGSYAPELTPTCISEAFGVEIPDENRLTDEDIKKHIASKKQVQIDIGSLPFKTSDDHTGLDKTFPMYISKVLEFYEQGGRYKEFRNILKKQRRKEEKQKQSPMPTAIKSGNYTITFE